MTARLFHDQRGASAAEFAMVVPLLLLLIFAIIDGGRLMWTINRADKAVQMGARYAAVTRMVPSSLAAYKFATAASPVASGTPVPVASWAGTTCVSDSCSNDTAAGPSPGFDEDAFAGIVQRMAVLFPEISDATVQISYKNVELGYSGDPYGADVAPEITVSVSGLTYTPLTTLSLAAFNLPTFKASVTMEDGRGTQAN